MAKVRGTHFRNEKRNKEKSQGSSSFLSIALIGIGLSLLLFFIPLLLNQNISLGLLITLVGIAATFLFDICLKVRDNEELFSTRTDKLEANLEVLVENESNEIKQAIKLGEYLAKDAELRGVIESIVDTCEEVKMLNVDVFTRKVDEYLKKCKKLIGDLSDGKEILKSEFSFLPSEYATRKSIARIVMSAEPLYLDTPYGRNMIQHQENCIELNRDITFVWLQERHILTNPKFRLLIQKQKEAGVDVLIAEKEIVSKKLWDDYGIIDNRYCYTSSFDNGKPDRDDVTNEPDRIRFLEENFNQLKTYAETDDVYYAQKK